METVADFIFLGSKITADGDYSHEIKRCLLLWRKSTTNLDNILKSRHHLASKGPLHESYGFSSSHVRMGELNYEESWAPKNWCFWTVVLQKTLESLGLQERSNQSILKEISPECSLEGLRLKLKLQYFGHLMRRADSFKKTLMLEGLKVGGEGEDRGWDGWMASPTQWTWVWINSRSWWWTDMPGVLWSMGLQRVRHDWATKLNWTEAGW